MLNAEQLTAALRRAFNLGQTYWQQADSDSYKQNAKSEETRAKFDALIEETVAAIPCSPEQAIAAWNRALGVPASQPAALTDAQILAIAREQGDEAQHGFIFNKDGRWSVLAFARALLAAADGVGDLDGKTFCTPEITRK